MKKQLQTFFENNLPTYLDYLQQMVAVNSFTYNPAGVNQVAGITADIFVQLGFQTERVPSTNPNFGDHLVLTRKGSSNRKLGLISHLDTVFSPEEEITNDFSWQPQGDKIYGPGTVDVKSGTLMIYMVLDALRQFLPDIFEATTWVVLLNASEETLAHDFGDLCLSRLQDDGIAALVFEAGKEFDNTFQLVTARKGMAVYQISVEGRSSHAGANHAGGANAIVHLAEIVRKIAALTDYDQDLTFNIGTITGGTVTNRVPHFAQAKGEMRTFKPEVFEQGLHDLHKTVDGENESSSGVGFPCRAQLEITATTDPWPRNPATESLLAIWQITAQKINMQVIREERGGLSDGNHTWAQIPTIDGLGPDGGNAHCSEHDPANGKEQEFVRVSSLVPKAILNVLAIQQLLNV